jgi:ketosteroid isomerase-like protein
LAEVERGSSGPPVSRETIVIRWVDAFNARDIDGILAVLARQVDFHPLRLKGIAASYRGHDGVREWFGRLTRLRHDHRIVLHGTRDLGGGRVFASGALSLVGQPEVGPFCALHRLERGVIVAVHQYHSDSATAESLGLIG